MSASDPGIAPPAPAGRSSERARRIVFNAAKLVLGAGILVVIALNTPWRDVVVVQDPDGTLTPVRGYGLAVTGSWELQLPDGTRRSVPLDGFPILEDRDGRRRMRIQGEDAPMVVAAAMLRGTASMTVEGAPRTIALQEVALVDGGEQDGWVEKLPAATEGLRTVFGRVSAGRYALAMALIFLMYLSGVQRWTLLLRAQGLDVGFGRSFQLTFMGFFFNNVVPGLTGGDVVKAVMIARDHPGHRAEAVSTVIADRVIGILVLAGLSGAVLAFTFDRYPQAALGIFLFLGGVGLMGLLFFSRRIRRTLRLNELLRRLPFSGIMMRLDEAFLLYRDRKRTILAALGLSFGAHLCNVGAIYLMGMDLGVDRSAGLEGTPIVTYLATVPIVLIVSSVPLLPGGWGLGELMYGYFFRTVGVRNLGLSVGLSVLSRASMLAWSLLGGVFLVLHRKEAREALHDAEQEPPQQ